MEIPKLVLDIMKKHDIYLGVGNGPQIIEAMVDLYKQAKNEKK